MAGLLQRMSCGMDGSLKEESRKRHFWKHSGRNQDDLEIGKYEKLMEELTCSRVVHVFNGIV